jgi:hypothetical protein
MALKSVIDAEGGRFYLPVKAQTEEAILMKVSSALIASGLMLNHEAGSWTAESKPAPSYARDLRVVGQILDRKEVGNTDLVCVADSYIIRGLRKPNSSSSSGRLMKRIDAVLRGNFRCSLRSDVVDLRYNREEIFSFDYVARCKRSNISSMPDPYSLSHLLRSAGAYVDGRRDSSLIGISVKDRWVTIRFATAEGHPEETKQSLEYFYDYWVKMYLRRGSQAEKFRSSTYSAADHH